MKQYIIFTLIIGLSLFLAPSTNQAQNKVLLDCESGNRNADIAGCWSFGSTSFRNTADLVISGKWSTQSISLTNSDNNNCWIKTPWLMPDTGNITFKCRLDGSRGNGVSSKGIRISYIEYNEGLNNDEGTTTQFFEYNFTDFNSSAIKTITASLPTEIINSKNPYKLKISFVGAGGNQRAYSDNFEIDAEYYSDPTNGCKPKKHKADIDNDGIYDAEDQYPENVNKAYTIRFPAFGNYTYAFEDNWPNIGDFDFNDLVVDHHMIVTTNSSNQIVEINGALSLKATGAGFTNGFGISLSGIPSNAVLKSSGANETQQVSTKLNNGLEANQDHATYILFSNSFDILKHPGSGTGVNTNASSEYVEPATINYRLVLIENGVAGNNQPVDYHTFISNVKFFNPFIIVNGQRGREIHLIDYPPTNLADRAIFGTANDDSDINAVRYYKTATNVPWALVLPEDFDYPIEGNEGSITKAYNYFATWAESEGVLFPDWYTNKEDYRNIERIYSNQVGN